MAEDTEVKCSADLDTGYLRKIALVLGASGTNLPRPGDTKNNLLRKILSALTGC